MLAAPSQQATGAQLHSLREKSIVRSEAARRESWYELNEPLMRLVFEIKESRGRPIRLIVDFLRRWYSRSERRAKYASVPTEARMTRLYIEAALDLRGFSDAEPRIRETLLEWSVPTELLLDSGDFEKALDTVEEAIEYAGRSATAEHWSYHGRCLHSLKQYIEALQSYDQAIGIDPKYARAYNFRGDTLRSLKRYKEALQSYDRAIQLNPENADLHNGRGIALDDLKRYEEALQSYDRAIQLNPKDAWAFNNRGASLYDLKRNEEALQSYDRAIQLNPENAWTFNNRGVVLEDLKRYEEALESYDKAIELNPENATLYRNRGNMLQRLKSYDDALENYDRAIQLNPENAYLRFCRVEPFLAQGRWAAFLDNLQRAFLWVETDGDDWRGDTELYCRLILADSSMRNIWPERISELVSLYEEHQALKQLAQGVTESLPTLFEPWMTDEIAEAWNASWQPAGKGQADLEIPLRLLDAAVRWRRKPDRRILLRLPIEERRV